MQQRLAAAGRWVWRALLFAWSWLVLATRWVTARFPRRHPAVYVERHVRMDEVGLTIRRYYWPFGPKRIEYDEIAGYETRPLKAWHGQFRVHGIDQRGRWYHRDSDRGSKDVAIDLDLSKRIKPVLTPDDLEKVLELLQQNV